MSYFISSTNPAFNAKVQEVYDAATAHAKTVFAQRGIKMAVERLRPVHLGLTSTYSILYNSGNASTYKMQTDCAVFLVGLYSNSTNIKELTIKKGQEFLGLWSVREIVKFQEQQGAYAGNVSALQFKSQETLSVQIVATYGQTGTANEDIWWIGFAVMPESGVNASIVA